MAKLGLNVEPYQTQEYALVVPENLITCGNDAENITGIYFETADGTILEQALVLSPNSKDTQESFTASFTIPEEAAFMGYWLLSDGAKSWRGNQGFTLLDIVGMKVNPQGMVRVFQMKEHVITSGTNAGLSVLTPWKPLRTKGYGGQVYLSNSENNFNSIEWFSQTDAGLLVVANDSTDLGLELTALKSLVPCPCFNA